MKNLKPKQLMKWFFFVSLISFVANTYVYADWTSGPMSSDGSTIRTEGKLLYAYAAQSITINDVSFTRAAIFDNASMVTATPASDGNCGGSFGDEGLTGDMGKLLRDGWYWTGDDIPLSFNLTLTGLSAGHSYLFQLVSHRPSNSTTVSVNGSPATYIRGTHDGIDYTYGGTVVGTFIASSTTEVVTVTYVTGSGWRPLNAIQVRDLGMKIELGNTLVIESADDLDSGIEIIVPKTIPNDTTKYKILTVTNGTIPQTVIDNAVIPFEWTLYISNNELWCYKFTDGCLFNIINN